MADEEWFHNPNSVLMFGGALVRVDYFDSAKDLLYYFEKPWKWTTEHELWEGCNRPDLDEEGWDWFLRKLEELVGL